MIRAAYYNENDPKAALWLRELIRRNLIAPGDVDERSICDVKADDVRDYRQVHLFAGIGGWSYALRLAGWPDDRPVWSGSCPCQPFSCAGKGEGVNDGRNLWPAILRLVGECKPSIVFGEQVTAAIAHGWLDRVLHDLEGHGYACGAADLCASSVGAPHIRQRLYWVANAERDGRRVDQQGRKSQGRVADGRTGQGACGMEYPAGERRRALGTKSGLGISTTSGIGRLDNPIIPRLEGFSGHGDDRGGQQNETGSTATTGPWSDYAVVHCRDGKARRIESGSSPLAHGIPARVVRLRGYGNAILPYLAAQFIQSFQEAVIP